MYKNPLSPTRAPCTHLKSCKHDHYFLKICFQDWKLLYFSILFNVQSFVAIELRIWYVRRQKSRPRNAFAASPLPAPRERQAHLLPERKTHLVTGQNGDAVYQHSDYSLLLRPLTIIRQTSICTCYMEIHPIFSTPSAWDTGAVTELTRVSSLLESRFALETSPKEPLGWPPSTASWTPKGPFR